MMDFIEAYYIQSGGIYIVLGELQLVIGSVWLFSGKNSLRREALRCVLYYALLFLLNSVYYYVNH